MKKTIFLVLSIIMLSTFVGCNILSAEQGNNDSKITVVVSIVPEATFVEAVAGDLVEVVIVIPPGNSPANYQPTTMEMQALSDADLYFVMQVPTEEANILPNIFDFNENIVLVNLRDAVSEEYPLRYMESHEDEHIEEHEKNENVEHDDEHTDTIDPHIWLSPKRVIIMVQTIADELSKLDEENASVYQANAKEYIENLVLVDKEIKGIVDRMENKAFMIYHGAYGYFADDYGLEMISLEADGKSATAVKMQEVIEYAKEKGITSIFYQEEFDDRQAETIAEEIGGMVKKATPLSKDYIQGLRDFAYVLGSNG